MGPVLTAVAALRHDKVRQIVWSPVGDRFVVTDATSVVIYGRDGERIVERALERGRVDPFVFGTAWSPDGAHIATAEYGPLRLRDARDLSVIATADTLGIARVAFCEGGKALATGPHTHLHVVAVPSLADRGSLNLEWGGPYQSFDIDHVVADPSGTVVAASDYGGYSDDDWGHTAERGVPKLTIVDSAAPANAVHQITQRQPITDLVLDPWRRRLLVGNYARIVVRGLDAAEVAEWAPYGKTTVKAIGVCERYVATMPDIAWGGEPSVELWDPTTYARIARVPVMEGVPRQTLLGPLAWAAEPSPDGSRLVTAEHAGVRVYAVG